MHRFAFASLAVLLLAAPVPAANILLNSSFETWLLGEPLGWLTSNLIAESSAVQDPAARTGDWCARLGSPDTLAFVATMAGVQPGRHYGFNGWARVSAVLGGSFALQFLTVGLEPIGDPVLLPAYISADYREYDQWLTAPEGSALIAVSFVALRGVTVRVDDVTLEDTTVLAIEGSPPALTAAGPPSRRILATPAVTAALATDAVVFDAAGRRLADPQVMRPFRVYFVIDPPRRME
ncbi:MAG: hypothetical protein R6X12_02205 [bacterium]